MAFSNDEIIQLSDVLKYPYNLRDCLIRFLDRQLAKYGDDWETEVKDQLVLLTEINTEFDSLDGDVIEQEVDGEYQIQFSERRTYRQQVEAKKSRILAKLFRLIELYPRSESAYVIR